MKQGLSFSEALRKNLWNVIQVEPDMDYEQF